MAAGSSPTPRGRAIRTAALGPPPQPLTEALAIGTAVGAAIVSRTVASACGMDTEREQHEPGDAANLKQPVVEQQLLRRLALAGGNQPAVPRYAHHDREDRQRPPRDAVDRRQLERPSGI